MSRALFTERKARKRSRKICCSKWRGLPCLVSEGREPHRLGVREAATTGGCFAAVGHRWGGGPGSGVHLRWCEGTPLGQGRPSRRRAAEPLETGGGDVNRTDLSVAGWKEPRPPPFIHYGTVHRGGAPETPRCGRYRVMSSSTVGQGNGATRHRGFLHAFFRGQMTFTSHKSCFHFAM